MKGLIFLSCLFFSFFGHTQSMLSADSIQILYNSGNDHLKRGEYIQGQKDIFKCFKLAKQKYSSKDSVLHMISLKIGELFYEAGKVETAKNILQNNIEKLGVFKSRPGYIFARNTELLGMIALYYNDYELADNNLKQAGAIYHGLKGNLDASYARNLIYQAQSFIVQGSFTAAEALLRQARFILKKTENQDPDIYSALLLSNAILLEKLHNFIEAKEFLNELISLNQKLYGTDHPMAYKARYYLGSIHLKAGYLLKANEYISSAHKGLLKYYGSGNKETLLAGSLLGLYYTHIKNYQKADSVFQNLTLSINNYQFENPLLNAEIESQQAFYYYSIGKYESAIQIYLKSLEIIKEFLDNSHPFYVRTINDLSFLYWVSGKKQLADKYFALSAVNYINQFNRYFAFLSEQEKGYFYHDIRTFFDKYNSYILTRLNSRPTLSREMYNQQLANKALLFHTTQEIRKQVISSLDKTLQPKYARWIELKEHLSKLYKITAEDDSEENRLLLDSLEEKANYIEKEISLRIELDKTQKKNSVEGVSWKDIQKALLPGEASIEIIRIPEFRPDSGGYATGKILYSVLIITPETKKFPYQLQINDGNELETKLLNYYKNSIHHKVEDLISYNKFWSPIKSTGLLNGVNKIYISCDGVYNQINLNTFLDPETNKTVFDEIDIHLLTNTKDILRLKQKSDSDPQALTALFGYPDYYKTDSLSQDKGSKPEHHLNHRTRGSHDFKEIMRGGKIVDLPGTKSEIEDIQAIIKANTISSKVYLGSDASEESLKNIHNPRLLHIATHGFFMPDFDFSSDDTSFTSYNENPLTRSGIMLVGAGYAYSDETLERELAAIQHSEKFEDGILTAYEAMNINLLNTDLVILSACETGLGDVRNGEGVYGLQRALQTAGAKSVIMSLWKVSDSATKKLMVNFYSEWVKSKDKRKAFRIAQEKLKAEYPDPIFWGAFVMIGE